MGDLQINVTLKNGTIVTNTEELKEQLSAKMAEYENAVFTEETKSMARAELASLRKLKEAVESRRKEIKTQCMAPYNVFEKEVRELTAIIDKPINLIDKQIKEMEELRIKRRQEDVQKLYDDVVGEMSEWLPLTDIYDRKWNLAGTSMRKIREDIEGMLSRLYGELTILENHPSDARDEALALYKRNRDFTQAMSHISTYETNKAKALKLEEERRQYEEECRRQAEIERVKREERERLAAIERARADEREKAAHEIEAAKYSGEPATLFDEEDEDSLPFVQPNTITAFYKVVATPEELENVEMAFNSIGIYFERRDDNEKR